MSKPTSPRDVVESNSDVEHSGQQDDQRQSDSPRFDDGASDHSDDSDAHSEQHDTSPESAELALQKQKFLARRDVEFDVPDEVWLQERRCLLMLLEARMLLRELVEYKVKMMRTASGNLTISEIQNLLALYSENDEDGDFISGTSSLRLLYHSSCCWIASLKLLEPANDHRQRALPI